MSVYDGLTMPSDMPIQMVYDAVCRSRFHQNPPGTEAQARERLRCVHCQYVCTPCRHAWSERIFVPRSPEQRSIEPGHGITLSQLVGSSSDSNHPGSTEDSLQEGVRIARLLIEMVNDGRVFITDEDDGETEELPNCERCSNSNVPDNANLPYRYNNTNYGSGGIISDNAVTAKDSTAINVSQARSPGKFKRKSHAREGSPRGRKRRKTDHVYLPREIVSMIVSRAMDREPQCILDLAVPDWNICRRRNPALEQVLEHTRVVTYTRGAAEGELGVLTWKHEHHVDDHIFLPTQCLDERFLKVDRWCCNEAVRSYFQNGVQAFPLGVESHLNDVADEPYLSNWRDAFPMRGRRARSILPYDDEYSEVAKMETPLGPPHIFQLLRHIVIHSPLALLNIDARETVRRETGVSDIDLEILATAFDLDRASHLYLSWSQMPKLESVLLDLRVYSHDLNTDSGCISKPDILGRAYEMGRWLRLKLLVIAGLQSYSFFETSYESVTAEEIENEEELNGEPNWIRAFLPALRPGGRLMLIDRLEDESPNLLTGPPDFAVTP
ncbi:hypothetical protein F4779DRAFT_604709 [Xylariaceae sp. FL0662B]|nr:hypothetical protein F4779DRAFT_604709 [Xylariaceae sp. FL0662B]